MTAGRLIAGIVLLLSTKAARAQPTPGDSGFLLTELGDDRFAEVSVSAGRLRCDLCVTNATANALLGEVVVQVPLEAGLVATGALTVTRLGPRTDQPDGDAEWAAPHVRVGLRHHHRRGEWTLSAGGEVAIPLDGDSVGHLRDDPSRWPWDAGSARLEGGAAWRRGRVRAQAQLAVAIEGAPSDGGAIVVRGGAGGALALSSSESAIAEISASLLRRTDCQACLLDDELSPVHVAVGLRSQRGPWRLGTVALFPLRDSADGFSVDPAIVGTVVAGRRF